MKNKLFLGMAVLFASFVLFSCESTKNNDKATLDIRLTDAPGEYDAVNIDLQGLQYHLSDGDGDVETDGGYWVEMENVETGIYDLLELSNGIDALLAEAEFEPTTLSQIRLLLGENNTIVIDGETHDLATPSAQQSGLKLKVGLNLEAGVAYTMWLDFDASRSITETGSGKYSLKPTIRVFTEATSGGVEGNILPAGAMPYVQLYNDTDTMGTVANAVGYYLIGGVPAGTYNLLFQGEGYEDLKVEGIEVALGETTTVDDATLTEVAPVE